MTQAAYRAQIAMAMFALTLLAGITVLAGCSKDEDKKDSGPASRQIDRMAFPGINTVLVPSASKDIFNASYPRDDNAGFLAAFTTTITGLRANVAARGVTQNSPEIGPSGSPFTPAALADALCPDVVNVNLGITTGNSFTVVGAVPTQTLTGLQLNGRNLTDDVIDAALILILNNGAATDAIGPKTYLGTFPYLNVP